MPVPKSQYRRPLTGECIEKMENGSLDYFDEVIWGNLNSGALEQYFEDKNRKESFTRSKFNWRNVVVGIVIGSFFALINQYVGLKVGMIVSGSWYVTYLLGLALKWDPTEVNITAGASTGASQVATGFVFSYPAIYLLSMHPRYATDIDAAGNFIYIIDRALIPALSVAMIAAILGAMLGVMYFTIFRRIWLVEDPLPVPGFEASLKLVDIANDISHGASNYGQRSIKLVITWTAGTMFFTFLRDFPLIPKEGYGNIAVMDALLTTGTRYDSIYYHGKIQQPLAGATYTYLAFEFIPIQFAIGWFMRFRTAFLVVAGTLLTWFIIVPMTVASHYPIYVPTAQFTTSHYFDVTHFPLIVPPSMWVGNTDWSILDPPALVANSNVARVIAVGAILGGGLTALIKMAPVFKTAMADIFALGGKDVERKDFVQGRGWYEWPMTHIPVMASVTAIGIIIVFILGGLPPLQSIVFAMLLVIVTFILGAIGVKVMGEVGSTPVSGTSFIVLLILISIFQLMGTSIPDTVIMSLIGATVFGTALSLSSDIISDFKIGLYAGTRPYHLVKGELSGIPFGAIIAAAGASVLAVGLATILPNGEPVLNLAAPQAHAFSTFVLIILGPNPPWDLFGIGLMIGVFAEVMTGMGTSFGLGMYLPLPTTLPLFVGGSVRDWWQKTKLDPKAKALGWSEKEKTKRLVETYMMGTGLIIGEALMGTVIAIYLVLPLLTGG